MPRKFTIFSTFLEISPTKCKASLVPGTGAIFLSKLIIFFLFIVSFGSVINIYIK